MPEGPANLVRVTFYNKADETDAELLAACEGSIGSCLPHVMGVFQFVDGDGVIAKDAEQIVKTDNERRVLSARIQKAWTFAPLLRLKRWWLGLSLEGMRAKQMQLIIRQMATADYVVEVVRGRIRELDRDLYPILEILHQANRVEVTMYRGGLRDLDPFLVDHYA